MCSGPCLTWPYLQATSSSPCLATLAFLLWLESCALPLMFSVARRHFLHIFVWHASLLHSVLCSHGLIREVFADLPKILKGVSSLACSNLYSGVWFFFVSHKIGRCFRTSTCSRLLLYPIIVINACIRNAQQIFIVEEEYIGF